MVRNNLLDNAPIGVFDSGLGGLTVLNSLQKKLPGESFLYFGDTAHVPYGTRSRETVIRYSTEITRFLVERRVKLIVIACNTASAIALESLQAMFPVPIIGVVEPIVEKAMMDYQSGAVGIIGTRATISSKAYYHAFKKRSSTLEIVEKACPLFVPIIEERWGDTPVAQQVAEIYLSAFEGIQLDSLVLGCTHYPMISGTLSRILPKSVRLLSSGEAVAEHVETFLDGHDLRGSGNHVYENYFVTDFPQQFDSIGSRFLGRDLPNIEQVNIFS